MHYLHFPFFFKKIFGRRKLGGLYVKSRGGSTQPQLRTVQVYISIVFVPKWTMLRLWRWSRPRRICRMKIWHLASVSLSQSKYRVINLSKIEFLPFCPMSLLLIQFIFRSGSISITYLIPNSLSPITCNLTSCHGICSITNKCKFKTFNG